MGWGIYSTSLSKYIVWNSWKICIFSFIYFSIHSFKYLLCQYELMDIYVMLWVLTQYAILFFLLKLFHVYLLGALSVGFCAPLDHVSTQFCLLRTSLTLGTRRCSVFILYLPCPNSRISHFSKEPWLFCFCFYHYQIMVFRNQDLDIVCAHYY